MIHIIIGTKAQLIKVAPLMKELQDRRVAYNFILSGQHQETMGELRENFGLKEPDYILYSGPDIIKVYQMLFWGLKIVFKVLKNKKEIFKGDKNGIVINHGDTFTTLLGSILAKIVGLKNAHLESGLRSYNFFHPFPEEIFRYSTFAMTDYYFCPGSWAMDNLKKYKGQKINTVYNTLYDSVRLALANKEITDIDIPEEKFAIVSLHRYENVFRKNHFLSLLESIEETATKIKVLFILHPSTKNRLDNFGFYNRLNKNPNIELRPRYDYFDFIKLLNESEFIITDGGSNQEESFYLGKPCLLLRRRSERQEGLGENSVLSEYSKKILDDFVNNYGNYKKDPKQVSVSPVAIVADFLENNFVRKEAGSMIHIFIGTKAQFIKMAPVMKMLQERGIDYNFISTGQHKEIISDLQSSFGIKSPDYVLYGGRDITGVSQMFVWGIRVIFRAIKDRKKVFKGDKDGIILNHGETFTAILGFIIAKLLGFKIGHIESGHRSFNFFHPFPEEITRFILLPMADYYFCPGSWAVENVKKYKGKKINTRENTLRDSVCLALEKASIVGEENKKAKYAMVSIHRFENIFNKDRLRDISRLVERVAKDLKVFFIMHPPTKKQLKKNNLLEAFEKNKNIYLAPLYDYFDFIKLLGGAEFLVSDGGSNQEESHYLGVPCLLYRKETERIIGMGQNVVLSKYNKEIIRDFLNNYHKYRSEKLPNDKSPSAIIVDCLERDFVKK